MMKQFAGRLTEIVLSLLLIVGLLLSPTLVQESMAKLEIKKSSPVSITGVTVGRKGNETVVRGDARFSSLVAFGHLTRHVDFDAIRSNGETITRHDVRLVRKWIPKKRGHGAFFVARLATDFSEVSILRIRYEDTKHDGTGHVRSND